MIPNCPDNLVYTFAIDGVVNSESWLGIDLSTKTLNLAPEFPDHIGALVLSASVRTDGLGEAFNEEFTITINVQPGSGGINTQAGPTFESPGLVNQFKLKGNSWSYTLPKTTDPEK
jgi:hypothetical protein